MLKKDVDELENVRCGVIRAIHLFIIYLLIHCNHSVKKKTQNYETRCGCV